MVRLIGRRIGFVHPKFKGVGGAENLIAAQASYLRRQGYEISLVSRVYDAQRWHGALADVALHDFHENTWFDWLLPRATRLERAVPRLERLVRDCDLVIAHNFPSCALLGRAQLPNVPRAWYCNEPNRALHLIDANPYLHARLRATPAQSYAERAYESKLRWYRWNERYDGRIRRLRELDRQSTGQLEIICANSEYTRDNVRRTYQRSDARVIYPIVQFPRHGRNRAGLDRSRGLQILTHGRLDPVKNVDHVLRGFALYRGRVPGTQLHVVGVGPERKHLLALTRELGLDDAVRFHGFLPQAELERVYDACDVFALTPVDEPFGMVFPEAAARGLLLVGPNHAGPNEILDGGRLGWTCDAFEPAALAEVFERVAASSDADVNAMRTRADAACRSRYSEVAIGPQLASLATGAGRSAVTA
jgi:glycosyltransferase involved in cell wall biosynthesis